MRFLIANWKMQLSLEQSIALAERIVEGVGAVHGDVRGVLCPSHTALASVAQVLVDTPLALGAQDVFWAEKGAYTGEVSPAALKELDCTYCIVGHSERRQLGETDEMVAKKIRALLAEGITPILCVGETKEERDAGRKEEVVRVQLRKGLDGVVSPSPLFIAYEPRWVIGSGAPVAPEEAEAMHGMIADELDVLFPGFAHGIPLLYGGALTSGNLSGFLAQPHVHGALVGGASLDAAEFLSMFSQM